MKLIDRVLFKFILVGIANTCLARLCVFTGLNYAGQRLVVFRKKTNQEKK